MIAPELTKNSECSENSEILVSSAADIKGEELREENDLEYNKGYNYLPLMGQLRQKTWHLNAKISQTYLDKSQELAAETSTAEKLKSI